MRLSELLRSRVVDADGTDLGPVNDVLLVQDGPAIGTADAALRVDGLVVGRRTVGTRLGYAHGGTRGPLLLQMLFGALARRARYVPWAQVESWDGGRVSLTAKADDLRPPL